MAFNLLAERWLPIRRHSGALESIRPSEITSSIDSDPIVAIEWPRPDFRIATLEFLIGLLATACPPTDRRAWRKHWTVPPSPDELASAFAPLAHAFVLDGDGPRFMQDFEDLSGDPATPETLLIEAPGDATLRKNTALLVKAGRVARLSRAAAAMALFTLQTYAPSGGRGNLTSLRGGGPLTTLVLPGSETRGIAVPLWRLLWANVPDVAPPPTPSDHPKIFPWLTPTRTSESGRITTPSDTHELQAFWGMPRRIRLDFVGNDSGASCDLLSTVDAVMVTGWRQRPSGTRYAAWRHPLSPYYRGTGSDDWLPVHPQLGGLGYRHWLALVLGDADGKSRLPARAVSTWRERDGETSRNVRSATRVLAAGYDMDNMKARAFVESEMPLLMDGDRESREAQSQLARALVNAADEAAHALRLAIRSAILQHDAKVDSSILASTFEAFWDRTHDEFFTLLRRAALAGKDHDEDGYRSLREHWLSQLRDAVLALFDETAQLDPGAASLDPQRIVTARKSLWFTFKGYGPFGTKIFEALQLPPPTAGKSKTGKRSSRKADA